jgi:NAD(P)-dependent dehydrogenase (short-subunit alcohol dehydrogenase family)
VCRDLIFLQTRQGSVQFHCGRHNHLPTSTTRQHRFDSDCTVFQHVCSSTPRIPINLTREIYGPMCARGKGVIVNIVGISGDRPDAYYIAGSCANAALIMFSRSLGGDSIRHGVRVVAVNPGPVETEKHIRDTERLAQERFGEKSRVPRLRSSLLYQRQRRDD